MKKNEILAAIEAAAPLVYDRDYHRRWGRSRVRIVRPVRLVEEGEEFSKEEARALSDPSAGFLGDFFSKPYAWRDDDDRPWKVTTPFWIVETIEPEGDLAPLSEIVEEYEPGLRFLSKSRYLVGLAEDRVPGAKAKYEARLAEEENVERYAGAIEKAKALPYWVRLEVGSRRVRFSIDSSRESRDLDLGRVFAAAPSHYGARGKATLPDRGVSVRAVREAIEDLSDSAKFGEILTFGEATIYADAGFEVEVEVVEESAAGETAVETIEALLDALREEIDR